MGLGETVTLNCKGGVACSICLEAVTGSADRSMARLQCGHEFHLDCIGSAFNAKGVMQCPNCRKVEKGNWLYSNGSYSVPDLGVHEWEYVEEPSEMPYRVPWFPVNGLAHDATSFEELESSPTTAFQDLVGHPPIFTAHPTTSSSAHSYPSAPYFQPLQPSSTTASSNIFSESHIAGPSFRQRWPSDVQIPHGQSAIGLHYPLWDYQLGGHTNGADRASVSSATMGAARLDSDGLPRAGSLVQPYLFGNQSRVVGSFVSTSLPPYLSNSGVQAHVHEHDQHYNSRGMHGTMFAGARRPGAQAHVHEHDQHHNSRGMHGTPFAGARHPRHRSGSAPLAPPDHTSFYSLFPSTQSSCQSRFAPFPPPRVDTESDWWGPFRQPTRSSDSSSRMVFGLGSEMLSSQGRSDRSSYRQTQVPPHW